MKVSIDYNLPDDIEEYTVALLAKQGRAPQLKDELPAVKELHTAIINYMLQPSSHEALMQLNRMLDKYA